ELAGECRLTCPLKTGQQDDGRRRLGEMDRSCLAAEDPDELLVDDLDDLLCRVERLSHLSPASTFLDCRNELAHDRQGDIRLEPVGERVEHRLTSLRGDESRSLYLDATTGVHVLDRAVVRRQYAATFQLHGRRQELCVRQPFLAKEDEPADVLHRR